MTQFASHVTSPQVLGLLALAVGIWGVVISEEGDYEELTGGNLISGAVLLIVSGFITIVVAMFGFCGAAGMWRPLLVIVSHSQCSSGHMTLT